ncbi:MAG: glyoxalase/bleomycin resistance/extradiol dioxygenase family protein [Bacteroidetes bacterium]|nr:glyoxalase/bleomycin resistance/extradiol dioxygenase family protein [Bacteroidota bacterium]
MPTQIFINLPVADVSKSQSLYEAMGFSINPKFSDDTAKCMIYSESIFVMLMHKDRFSSFTSKPIADTKNNIAALLSLSQEGTEQMNRTAESAIKAGATEPNPMKDYGFMQLRTIEDFDGHTWEIFFMDESKFPQQS